VERFGEVEGMAGRHIDCGPEPIDVRRARR